MIVWSVIAKLLLLIRTMALSAADRSTQRTIMTACVILALLALPFSSILFCEVAHVVDDHAPVPLGETCCDFLCLTMLVGALAVQLRRLSILHVTLY